jgi:soluble lytic murein transglycosylase
MMAGKALLSLDKPKDAVRLLETHYATLAQPAGGFLFAQALQQAGQRDRAAAAYARVYFEYPQSAEAAQAGDAWKALGSPGAEPKAYLMRTERAGAGQAAAIRSEMQAVSAKWAAPDRELALVRVWALEARARKYVEAKQALAALKLEAPEADAERFWNLYQISKRLGLEADRRAALDRLAKLHASSPFYMEALLQEGYRHLTENDYGAYEPLYKACADHFERSEKASFCHWKVAWSSYFRRRSDAEALMRDHLLRFPASEKANAALYFLGRLAEGRGETGKARAYFDSVIERFPNTYYALVSAERVANARIRSATPSAEVMGWVSGLAWPARSALPNAESTTAKTRRERANLLQMAGLDNYAEAEFRAGAKEETVPLALTTDLAEFLSRVGETHRGLRSVKGLLPGYLYFPWDQAGERFWRVAFPLPFQREVELYSREHGVDPYLVAGLIRQESEFNPKVISVANAYGLTQILPSTGRELSRRIGLSGFTTTKLFDPAINLRLGTYYIRMLLKSCDGRWEEVLAAYNAGAGRVRKWRTFGEYREPAEFIETIPFDETREYVQSVLRNAAVYRKLYEGKSVAIHSTNEPRSSPAAKPEPPKPSPVRRATAVKKTVPKRTHR